MPVALTSRAVAAPIFFTSSGSLVESWISNCFSHDYSRLCLDHRFVEGFTGRKAKGRETKETNLASLFLHTSVSPFTISHFPR